jgi:hypothetical protein
MGKEWLVWSIEHQAWWGPNWAGYVEKRSEAGRYTYSEAKDIVATANMYLKNVPNEAMIHVDAFKKAEK